VSNARECHNVRVELRGNSVDGGWKTNAVTAGDPGILDIGDIHCLGRSTEEMVAFHVSCLTAGRVQRVAMVESQQPEVLP